VEVAGFRFNNGTHLETRFYREFLGAISQRDEFSMNYPVLVGLLIQYLFRYISFNRQPTAYVNGSKYAFG
jgi:hypothetical protein